MDKFIKKINEVKSQKLPFVMLIGNKENNKLEIMSQGLTKNGVAFFLSTAHMFFDNSTPDKKDLN